MLPHDETDLSRIYSHRFKGNLDYRKSVWIVLVNCFFSRWVPKTGTVLDLGCGYGEFINQVVAGKKYAMDLNPDAPNYLSRDVAFLHQDCSLPWPLAENSVDVVFTSNFFEHLPDKPALGRTLDQIKHCLKPGGVLLAMGPNIKCLPGAYWDFWDHYLPLTELSLKEALDNRSFVVERCIARFLPYTMSGTQTFPSTLIRLYLAIPIAWRIMGKQFLLVAKKS